MSRSGLSVLYLGPQSGTSLHRQHAFARLGHRVEVVDPRKCLPPSGWVDRIEWHATPALLAPFVNRGLQSTLADRRFDLCFVDGGSLVGTATLRALRSRCQHLVNFNHDDPFGKRDGARFAVYRQALAEYDLVVVVRKINVAEAISHGARDVLRYYMVSDEVAHRPREMSAAQREQWSSEVAFVGTWMPERGPFLAQLIRNGVPLTIYGPNWQKAPEWEIIKPALKKGYLDGDEYAFAVQGAKISLGLLSRENRDQHTTRTFEIPALGGLLCAQRTPEHEQLFAPNEEAVFWSDASQCAAICSALLHDDERRKAIALAGQRRAQDHPYRSERLLSAVIDRVIQ